MNISYSWLSNYIDCELTPEEMATALTDIGLEIEDFEKIESIKGGLEGIVIGEVVSCTEHPDSDHLHVTSVNIGQESPLQIVCGAPNCRQGLKVAVATIGAVLHPTGSDEEFRIKKSKIRGVESFGMLCAEDEIGVGTDHAGIMELRQDAAVGTPAREYFGIKDDYVFGIGLTPNRIDAASHYGVARDLAAYLRARDSKVSLTLPSADGFSVDNNNHPVSVRVECPEAAPRYTGVVITGLKVAPSPEWLQNDLRAIGINPKNNVVDVTNFILHEMCQPLHAFDLDKVAGNKIVVRTCPDGTQFRTLDGTDRKLTSSDLMICDSEKPMCIAGVFGGEDSGVSDTTTSVFLESAYFNPVWVRKTARRHGLSTDSSFRFERGIDPNMCVHALKRAAALIRELAGGEISSEIVDIYPHKINPFSVEISYSYINSLTGKEIGESRIKTILKALEIEIKGEKDGVLYLSVPTYRVDVSRPADVVEEILRIYGYNNVEIPEHVNSTLSYEPRPNKDRQVNRASDMLTARGFNEIMCNSLSKAAYYQDLKSLPLDGCVRILNPLSNDLNVMRRTLLFGMMESIENNVNHRMQDLRLYEFGNCYSFDPSADNSQSDAKLAPYSESFRLAIANYGLDGAASWNSKPAQSDLFTLKGTLELLLRRFGLDLRQMQCRESDSDLYRNAVSVMLGGKEFMTYGSISPAIRKMFDLKGEVFYAELDFGMLLKMTAKNKVAAAELPKFPEVRRDLALLVDSSVTFDQLRRIAASTEKKLIRKVSLFDVYQGDKLPQGKKSYALSFILQDESRTLDDRTIDKVMSSLIEQYRKKAGAEIR